MPNLKWGISSIVFVIACVYLFLLFESPLIANFMLALLGGSVAGFALSIVHFSNETKVQDIALSMFIGIVGAAIAWLLAFTLLAITTIKFYHNTALAFDLIVGIVGAASACATFINSYSKKPRSKYNTL